ncbi:MlpB protein [Flavobacterium sp. JRM]|nr:MlpB protein [Flavobacterium sp. JRM]
MKTYSKSLIIVAIAAVLISCKDKEAKEQITAQTPQEIPVQQDIPNIAKHVPNDEVCMVNDKHMEKKQMEVPYDGKMYYGCCAMCVERIPSDESVRKATDPFTGEKVDKSSAYIVSLNQEGNVAYFASEENFQKFMKDNEKTKN